MLIYFLRARPPLAVGSFKEIRVKMARKIASFAGIHLFLSSRSLGVGFS
jgi:hypothetical protein